MVYAGIGENRGRLIIGEAEALAYACAVCGVIPLVPFCSEVSGEFRRMLLEWFYSGDWVLYASMQEYETWRKNVQNGKLKEDEGHAGNRVYQAIPFDNDLEMV